MVGNAIYQEGAEVTPADSWAIVALSVGAAVVVYMMFNAAMGSGQGMIRAWRARRYWRALAYQRARAEVNWAIERVAAADPSRYWLNDDEEWELHDALFHLRQVRASR